MKKISLFLLCSLFFIGECIAETPKWSKKVRHAIFSVITYDKENKILNTGNGFFIRENGEAVSDYSLFKGAERAIVITNDGKEMEVTHILGAHEIYDVIKFRVDIGKQKINILPLALKGAAVGEKVWLLPYSTSKEATYKQGNVTEVVAIDEKYQYYTLDLPTNEKTISCPIANMEGEVVGMIQQPAQKDAASISYAIDANYAASLSIKPLSANNSALRSIGIKKALPPTEEEALVLLYMRAGQADKEGYMDLLNEFIQTYPENAEGYQRRAALYTQMYKDSAHFELAEADMAQALKISDKKDEIYHAMCRIIFQHVASEQSFTYKDWTLNKSLETVQQAIAIDSLPLYLQTEAELLFALKDYEKAYQAFQAVNNSNMATAMTFFSAARSLQLQGVPGKEDEIIVLLDKAVKTYAEPYPIDAAPYIWERGKAYAFAGKYRQAVMDYNKYHELTGGDVNDHFYYLREQAAIAGRMNQLALDDIAKAIELDPKNADYLAEQASLQLRFNMIEKAIESCQKAIEITPDYADCYRILGLCHIQQKNKEEAIKFFQRAKELGDEHAEALIQKYSK